MDRLADRLMGHGLIINRMISNFSRGNPGQTWLLSGPKGIGKFLAARALAQSLLCEVSFSACGRCPSCHRVAIGQHEGLLVIRTEESQLKVEAADRVVEWLHLRGWSQRRVILLDEAEKLNLAAANKLLKTLEEPPADTFIFLVSSSPATLLPTIRSRCRNVIFHPLKKAEVAQLTQAPEWVLRLSMGSPRRAQELQEPGPLELREEALDVFVLFFQDRNFLGNEKWRELFKNREAGREILEHWAVLARDLAFAQQASGFVLNSDRLSALQSLSTRLPTEKIFAFWQGVLNLRWESQQFYRDITLGLEQLWVKIHTA
ncbi:MAG: DNA polymerase III subunit [Bdellovibrionaceae bacterium]|nr:DNA polymerase III subunit [Pseudobdellovibrionaceae bacterium]